MGLRLDGWTDSSVPVTRGVPQGFAAVPRFPINMKRGRCQIHGNKLRRQLIGLPKMDWKNKKRKVLKVVKLLQKKRLNFGMRAMEFRVLGKWGEKPEFWAGQD